MIFKQVLIVFKADEPAAFEMGDNIRKWLARRDIKSMLVSNTMGDEDIPFENFKADMALVLGGDGTMLSVARKLNGSSVPILGINYGNIGFLTETCPRKWENLMDEILHGNFRTSRRCIFTYEHHRSGRVLHSGKVVNDLVVSRGNLARLIRVSVRYGENFVGELRADGLIISTPTGATAYSVSAGGPVTHPEMELAILTPVCTFMHSFPPLVLPVTDPVEVEVMHCSADVLMSMDGQTSVPLLEGDRVLIRKSPLPLILISRSEDTFFHKLNSKGVVSGAYCSR